MRLKHAMDCKKPETFFKKTDFTGSDIIAKDIPAGSKETLPADYKCGAALAKAYKDKPTACSGFKNVASAQACCEKCSTFPACQYWSYGTSGANAKYVPLAHRIDARVSCRAVSDPSGHCQILLGEDRHGGQRILNESRRPGEHARVGVLRPVPRRAEHRARR